MTPFARPGLIREEVYQHLRRSVLDGEFVPGERLGEVELGERLGVSRTPIREAMMRLTQDGLLVAEANKGVRVRRISADEARDIYAVRAELDGLSAALAAQHHTPADAVALRAALAALNAAALNAAALKPDATGPGTDYREQTLLDLAYHHAVTAAAHNAALSDLSRDLEQRVALIKHQTRTYNAHPDTQQQHAALLDAILQRDPDAARAAARRHVQTFGALVLADLSRPDPLVPARLTPARPTPAAPPVEVSHA